MIIFILYYTVNSITKFNISAQDTKFVVVGSDFISAYFKMKIFLFPSKIYPIDVA